MGHVSSNFTKHPIAIVALGSDMAFEPWDTKRVVLL